MQILLFAFLTLTVYCRRHRYSDYSDYYQPTEDEGYYSSNYDRIPLYQSSRKLKPQAPPSPPPSPKTAPKAPTTAPAPGVLSSMGSSVGTSLVNGGRSAMNTASSVGSSVGTSLAKGGKSAMNTASSVGSSVGTSIVNGGKSAMNTASSVGSSVGTSLVNGGKSAMNTASSVGSSLSTSAYNGGKSVMNSAYNTGASMGTSLVNGGKSAIAAAQNSPTLQYVGKGIKDTAINAATVIKERPAAVLAGAAAITAVAAPFTAPVTVPLAMGLSALDGGLQIRKDVKENGFTKGVALRAGLTVAGTAATAIGIPQAQHVIPAAAAAGASFGTAVLQSGYNVYDRVSSGVSTARTALGTLGDVANVGLSAAGFGNFKSPRVASAMSTAGGSVGAANILTDAAAEQPAFDMDDELEAFDDEDDFDFADNDEE